MTKTFIINGNNINNIETFYKEINEIFMKNVDWKLGASLDALNDMLYGGFGEIDGNEEVIFIWKNFEKNKIDLGYECTKEYYENKLKSPQIFNVKHFQEEIEKLEKGQGQTYMDIILEIINDHKNIKLIKQ
ncbi:hypothetical protein DICPUDRAFT_77835 [Dictyostelium purpureum]|uniref:Barstar (barnase inhibitor) domain-containing protein n=1 Tax=Dictyostelium purpureum TaxID=5786 RepID=F0ZHR9_DICPU|nr:uncharacterized protein DICPUDRAFT_77835 [Dictyostelium purpureum]EGC36523.1 hypothetical protein DICPUDRAFT_77835 [Dictyostelium purpureum]|eukprot:XP_003286968.1 hypothetical protein DICPUDRAFT_77835 [Dictyostelium purpureum]